MSAEGVDEAREDEVLASLSREFAYTIADERGSGV